MVQHMYDITDPKEKKIVDDEFRRRKTKQKVDHNKFLGIRKPSPAKRKNSKRNSGKS
jgi:hypothetical protein